MRGMLTWWVVGAGNWFDALCLPAEEERGGSGERERGEDHIYEGCGRWIMIVIPRPRFVSAIV